SFAVAGLGYERLAGGRLSRATRRSSGKELPPRQTPTPLPLREGRTPRVRRLRGRGAGMRPGSTANDAGVSSGSFQYDKSHGPGTSARLGSASKTCQADFRLTHRKTSVRGPEDADCRRFSAYDGGTPEEQAESESSRRDAGRGGPTCGLWNRSRTASLPI